MIDPTPPRRPGIDGLLRTLVWTGAAVLLVLPAIAMRYTTEVNWTGSDFVFAAVLLGAACGGFELALRASANWTYRAALAAAVAGAFLLVWINAAVGVIGTENDPANLMYGGVLAILVGGAVVVRLRAAGMARVLLATGAAQVLVAAVAYVAGFGLPESRPTQLVGVTLFFLAPWLTSAALFHRAARSPAHGVG